MDILLVIEAARAALRGERDAAFRVLPRRDGAPPVALLATLGRGAGDLVLPLAEGKNFVGRGTRGSEPYGPMPQPHVVEQAQWFVTCAPGDARVVDAASTNLSVLCPRGVVVPVAPDTFGWAGIDRLPNAAMLPHLSTLMPPGARADAVNAVIARHGAPLQEGDVLRSAYATFVFAWAKDDRG